MLMSSICSDWVDFKPTPMAIGAAEVYYWSMDKEKDLDRVPANVTTQANSHVISSLH